jgi:hypothetical protein
MRRSNAPHAEVLACAAELHDRRRFRVLLPSRLRRIALAPVLALDARGVYAAGTHAVPAIRRHTPDTDAEALALIEQLARIGNGGEEPGSRYADREAQRTGDEECLMNGGRRRATRQGQSGESRSGRRPEQAPAGQDG